MKKDVRQLYDALAASYDARWEAYIARSVAATVQRLSQRAYRRVLDVGCGTGAVLAALRQRLPEALLVGVDVSEAMLAQARQKLGADVWLIGGKAERLPFASDWFDLVISNSSFHFWDEPKAGLQEVRRVLQADGELVLTDWCDDYWACKLCDKWLRLVDPSHQHCFGSRDCQTLLATARYADVTVEKYKINWLWGLMTATARNTGSAPARSSTLPPQPWKLSN